MNIHAMFLVQNLSVPMDRRVWQECQSVQGAGIQVSVICPRADGEAARETLNGIRIYRYRWPKEGKSPFGFAREFAVALWRMTLLAIAVGIRTRPRLVQYCNPPDTLWVTAIMMKILFGSKLIFDQHDLSPEIYRSRTAEPNGLVLQILSTLQSCAHRLADLHIFPNESYRAKMSSAKFCTESNSLILYSTPAASFTTQEDLKRPHPAPGRKLVTYIGIMGPQDDVHMAIYAAAQLKNWGRPVHLALLGYGEMLPRLKALASELGLTAEDVTFAGKVNQQELVSWLSISDAGVAPDTPNPLADISSHNKVFEYMALGLPFASYPLTETKKVAEKVASFASEVTSDALAQALEDALSDDLRKERAAIGRYLMSGPLSWEAQSATYLSTLFSLIESDRTIDLDTGKVNLGPDMNEKVDTRQDVATSRARGV